MKKMITLLTAFFLCSMTFSAEFPGNSSPEQTCMVVDGAVTVNWGIGRTAYLTLASGANTITLTNPRSGGRYVLFIKQPASGAAGTVTFSPVPWAASGALPTLTVNNGALDVITLIWEKTASKYILGYTLDVK